MTLTNLKTVMKTVTVASAKLTAPADRIGLGFGTGQNYPADSLSPGRFPTPHNPEPEQVGSRRDESETQTRMQLRPGGPEAVPPVSSAGCLTPGSRAVRVTWSLTNGASWSVTATDLSRNHSPKVQTCVVRTRIGSDCQSPDRVDDKRTLLREVASATTAGK